MLVVQLEEVLYHKFVQHPHLRGMLMRTGYAPLVYQEPDASLVDASVNAPCEWPRLMITHPLNVCTTAC